MPKLEGDVPCELCEQLVMHLRTVLVSNTTEKEFEQVLLGLCLTTKSYKKQVCYVTLIITSMYNFYLQIVIFYILSAVLNGELESSKILTASSVTNKELIMVRYKY